MKTKLAHPLIHRAALLLLLSALNPQPSTAFAQGTAFTYQGRLNDGAGPANGTYDLRFTIYDSSVGGGQEGNSATNPATGITNGLFTVTLDFGNQFPGASRFLEIGVRTNGAADFFTMSPRQSLTPSPYAITAESVISGGIAPGTYGNAVVFNNGGNSFSGSFNGNGGGITNVNAATLGGLSSANFWKTTGNTGTSPGANFLGTADNQPLEIRVNGRRALRLEPGSASAGSPNLIAGSSVNVIDPGVSGSVIAGGGTTNFSNGTNRISSDYSSILGGIGNVISTNSAQSAIIGGEDNTIQGGDNFIGGGLGNYMVDGAGASHIGGGAGNVVDSALAAAIGGGWYNQVQSNSFSAVGGGFVNYVYNQEGGTISGGLDNQIGGTNFTGGAVGTADTANTISGGGANVVLAGSIASSIAGGLSNTINSASYATIAGGFQNAAAGDYGFAAGRRAKANNTGAFVWADSQNADFASTAANQFLIRAAGGVGIGTNAPASALHIVDSGDTEISIQSSDTGSHRWTLQSSGNGTPGLEHSFQIIDRTASADRFFISTNGNVGIGTSNPTNRLHVAGGVSATVFVTTSDRNAKENFERVTPLDVLAKVAALPITRWTFKEMPGQQHLGPMAQDFRAAFGLGAGDTGIATVDADGVALAAIQGLNEKLEVGSRKSEVRMKQLEAENTELRRENAGLERRLDNLEKSMHNKLSN